VGLKSLKKKERKDTKKEEKAVEAELTRNSLGTPRVIACFHCSFEFFYSFTSISTESLEK